MRYTQCLSGLLLSLCTCVLSTAAEQAVGCQGRIMPASRIHRLIAPADQGVPIVKKLFVTEGDAVEEGQPIASLRAEEPAKELLAQANARHQLAVAELASARSAGNLAKHEAARAVVEARSTLAEAELALALAKTLGTRRRLPDENVQEARAALSAQGRARALLQANRASLAARLDAAVNTAQTQENEASWGAKRIATAALEEARAARTLALAEHDTRVTAATAEEEILKAKLAATLALNARYEREPAEVESAVKQVTLAKQRLSILEANTVAVAQHHTDTIAAAEAAIAEAAASARLAQIRLDMTHVRTPLKGHVLRLLAYPGETAGILAEIADISHMTVEAEVSIADISRVRAGDSATIYVPGVKTETGKPLTGKISRLGLRAFVGALADEDPAAFKDLRVFPVIIELTPETSTLLRAYTGVQVSVRINEKP
ncbi:MAG: HlyD family efflux transporter periplasmic adaptor subunit [Puniceicoccales bacterium]|nr:HlyD family efflux transporter periplasmic adaptor subunit [Puniceicoccales bacterium]